MKVQIIFRGSYPSSAPMAKRVHLYCKGLASEGIETNILIPIPTDRILANVELTTSGKYDNVHFQYLSSTRLRSHSFFKRRIDDFVGYFKLLLYLCKNNSNADVLFIIDIRNIVNLLIYLIARFTKTKVVYELNEHPEIITSKFDFWLNKRSVYKLFDGYIVISNSLLNLVSSFQKKESRTLVVPALCESNSKSLFTDKRIESLKPYILHTGTILEEKDGISAVLKTIHILNNQMKLDIKLLLSGSLNNTLEHKILKEYISDNNLQEKIIFLGLLTESELKAFQANCLTVIINKADNLQNNYCFPTKLAEYLSFSIPVIITKVGAAGSLFLDEVNAYIVEPNNSLQIANRVVDILNDPAKSKRIALKGKEISDTYLNYTYQAKFLSNYFRVLVG